MIFEGSIDGCRASTPLRLLINRDSDDPENVCIEIASEQCPLEFSASAQDLAGLFEAALDSRALRSQQSKEEQSPSGPRSGAKDLEKMIKRTIARWNAVGGGHLADLVYEAIDRFHEGTKKKAINASSSEKAIFKVLIADLRTWSNSVSVRQGRIPTARALLNVILKKFNDDCVGLGDWSLSDRALKTLVDRAYDCALGISLPERVRKALKAYDRAVSRRSSSPSGKA